MNSVNIVGSEARALVISLSNMTFCCLLCLHLLLITTAFILIFFFSQMSHFVLALFLWLAGSVFPHPSIALQNALSTVLYMAKAVRILSSFPFLTDMCPGILHSGNFFLDVFRRSGVQTAFVDVSLLGVNNSEFSWNERPHAYLANAHCTQLCPRFLSFLD